MKKYFIYLLIYSFGGFVLERIINLIAFGEWVENRVLLGPYQPLYGAGILMAIIVYDFVLEKYISNKKLRTFALLVTAIITTGISEAVTGFGYEFLYGTSLWDYNLFFTCNLKYICVIPTSLFGILSFLAIYFIHPYIKMFEKAVSNNVAKILFILFVIDIIVTFGFIL
ncbi:MAG: hypothetical protein KQ78_00608 [Candidatus Izimaplasma bacterium HR2]|nr:MAG: hypothetical protein KQ78_00608 [Candidatus Izimaplasma bacterium HR2]